MAMLNIKLTGVVAGAGAALLGAILLPALGNALKGATKIAISGWTRTRTTSKPLIRNDSAQGPPT